MKKRLEPNPVIDHHVDRILRETADRTRGDVIRHEEIQKWTGVRYETECWQTIITKLKRRFLRERKIELWSVTGVGYKLSTLTEHLHDNVVKRQLRASKQVRRSIFALEHLPSEELPPHDRLALHQRLIAMRQLDAHARAEMSQDAALRRVEIPPGWRHV